MSPSVRVRISHKRVEAAGRPGESSVDFSINLEGKPLQTSSSEMTIISSFLQGKKLGEL